MTTRTFFHSAGAAKWASICRLLRRVRHRLSATGDGAARGEAELCRLSGLPSCCFSHVVDRQR